MLTWSTCMSIVGLPLAEINKMDKPFFVLSRKLVIVLYRLTHNGGK